MHPAETKRASLGFAPLAGRCREGGGWCKCCLQQGEGRWGGAGEAVEAMAEGVVAAGVEGMLEKGRGLSGQAHGERMGGRGRVREEGWEEAIEGDGGRAQRMSRGGKKFSAR